MQPWILIALIAFAFIVVIALFAMIIVMRRSSLDSDLNESGQNAQGHWIGIGISIGAGLGVALGVVFDNFGMGIAMGVAVGLAIGAALEQKNKDNLRPLTEQEQKLQRWGVLGGLILLLVMAGFFLLIFFMAR